jgi:hypothetical protein
VPYVTVIIPPEGGSKYFSLNSKRCLVCDQGLPKLCKVEPFRITELPIASPDATTEVRAPRVAIQEEREDVPVSDDSFMLKQTSNEFVAYYGNWNPYLS